ncbi:hypothetical protein ACE3MQ_14525 [Paenibacillus lentus]
MQIAIGPMLSSTTIAVLQGILNLKVGYFIGMTYTSIFTPLAILGFMIVVV